MLDASAPSEVQQLLEENRELRELNEAFPKGLNDIRLEALTLASMVLDGGTSDHMRGLAEYLIE